VRASRCFLGLSRPERACPNEPACPAYAAGVGWDYATGLGTVNAYNLVTKW
jgi:hypothetical protein